jgi:hypothetical protein
MIRTMSVIDAEKLISVMVPDKIAEIRKLILEGKEESEIGRHYKGLAKSNALANLAVAARKKISTMEASFNSIISSKLSAATTDHKRQAVMAVQMAMASKFASLRMEVETTSTSWLEEVSPEDLMHVGAESKGIQDQFDELLQAMSDLAKSTDKVLVKKKKKKLALLCPALTSKD